MCFIRFSSGGGGRDLFNEFWDRVCENGFLFFFFLLLLLLLDRLPLSLSLPIFRGIG